MKLNSKTNLTGVIGYPLEKTLSPAIQNAAFNAKGYNWLYIPMPVEPKNLEKAIAGLKSLGFKGINVTMPHKETVMPFMDEIDSYAQLAGAVNTIHFEDNKAIGYNTDGRGFLHALTQEGGFNPEGKTVSIFGAGGAARAIAVILALNKVKTLNIVNRNLDKAEALIHNLKAKFKDCNLHALNFGADLPNIIDSTDLIVNSTPVGWDGGLIIDPALLHPGQLVADLVYVPEVTNLLQEAKGRGAKILSGKLMLLYQGAASWEIWTKAQAPIDVMRQALDKELERELSKDETV